MDTHRGSLNAGTSGDLRKWVTKIVHTLDGHSTAAERQVHASVPRTITPIRPR